jgi:hypothetical protein
MYIIFIILYCAYLIGQKLYNIATNQDPEVLRLEIKRLQKEQNKKEKKKPPAAPPTP